MLNSLTFRAPALTTLLLAGIATTLVPAAVGRLPQDDDLNDRYVVRRRDDDIVLIDRHTGHAWKQVASSRGRPPRWITARLFDNADEAEQWLASLESPATREQQQRETWVMEILLGAEYPRNESDKAVCHRWITSPKLSVFNADQTQQQVVKDVTEHLSDVLKDTALRSIRMVGPGNETADIEVHFIPLADFRRFAAERNFVYSGNNLGFFWANWDSRDRLEKAWVLLASDRLFGTKLEHFALEEITQALGPMNDSPLRRNSIFFSGAGGPARLSEDDQRLMRILYKHLAPGAGTTRVRSAVRRFWAEALSK